MSRPKSYRDLIHRRLDNMRRKFPAGYAQVVCGVHHMPPAYAEDDPDGEWWYSEAARDFAESIKQSNWYE